MRRLVVASFVLGTSLLGCRPDTVLVAFDPAAGTVYEYEVVVRSVTVTDLEDEGRRRVTDEATLHVRQEVLESGPDGVRLSGELARPGTGSRTFVMRFDRAAQLTEVESVEGIPAAALGRLGLSEIFPAAAAAPPTSPLAPGDEWVIDERVVLGEAEGPADLEGTGRLAELGVVDGADGATVVSEATLPVGSTDPLGEVAQRLEGNQTTRSTVVYDLADGAVLTAESLTTGDFAVTLFPPEGVETPPVRGTLTVEVRSETRRLR
jgi:hypothetical protein